MIRKLLQQFYPFDQDTFTTTFEQLGYAAAACYALRGNDLVFLTGGQPPDEMRWPPTVGVCTLHYTVTKQSLLPLGWHRPTSKRDFGRKAIFYFPAQDHVIDKIMLVLVPFAQKKRLSGALDGNLEAFAQKILGLNSEAENRKFFSEALLAEHGSKLGRQTKVLLDHELRTPIATMAGFAHVLAESSDRAAQEASQVILEQVETLLASVEKLSVTIGAAFFRADESEPVNGAVYLVGLVEEVVKAVTIHDCADKRRGKQEVVRLVADPQLREQVVRGDRQRLFRAFWEVIHNAVIFSLNTAVQVSVYLSGSNLIVDVQDRGMGVPVGSDDLIFLQFYKGHSDTKVRQGHRGMGLGLYLARYIVEQHAGQLTLVRQSDKGSLFRFILPRSEVPNTSQTG